MNGNDGGGAAGNDDKNTAGDDDHGNGGDDYNDDDDYNDQSGPPRPSDPISIEPNALPNRPNRKNSENLRFGFSIFFQSPSVVQS